MLWEMAFQSETNDVHANLLEGDIDYGEWLQQVYRGKCVGTGDTTSRKPSVW